MIHNCPHDWTERTEIIAAIIGREPARRWRFCRRCLRLQPIPEGPRDDARPRRKRRDR